MAYDNTNRGTLGKNQRKEKDTHPEYAGKINVDGVDYWLSAWVKEGPTGKFFSLSVRRKDEQRATNPEHQQRGPKGEMGAYDLDDDLPPF